MPRSKMPHVTRRAVIGGGFATGVLAVAAPAVGQSAAPAAAPSPALPPPRDNTVDILHGITIPDPFRPLESTERKDVAAWIDAQDARTRTDLGLLPTRAALQTFFNAAWVPWTDIPARHGSRYFATFNDGRGSRYGVQDGIDGPRRTLIDPKMLSADATISISNAFPDRLGTKVAYLLSEAGSENETLRVRDVDTGLDLVDTLLGCRSSTVAWRSDGLSFFYTRVVNDSDPEDWKRESYIICLHHLGQPQSADRIIFRLPNQPVYFWISSIYDADLLTIGAGVFRLLEETAQVAGCYVASLTDPSRVSEIFKTGTSYFELIATSAPTYYALTYFEAPKGRLVRIDPSNPRPERWSTVIPESDLRLDSVRALNDRLVVKHTENVGARVTLCDLDGGALSKVNLGSRVRVTFGSGHREDDHLLLKVDDYQRPSRIERLDLKTGKTSLFGPSAAKHDLSDAVVREVFVTSKDGTRVPMILIHQRGIALDGNNRTLLVGYGAFGLSQYPVYREPQAAWVRLGGIYAIAVIRGGGEFGQSWHDGGRRAKKQNSFDDFIACAEWLIAKGYTQPKRLGTKGNSAGGLLVLACMLQRPDLYGAVVAEDAVSDMLRLEKNSEFGDVDRKSNFKTMLAYSPLHNVRAGVKYPPLLMLVGDRDDNVLPFHAYKLVATLQEKAPETEAYLWVTRGAGHGTVLWPGKDPIASIGFLCDKLGGPLLDLPRIDN